MRKSAPQKQNKLKGDNYLWQKQIGKQGTQLQQKV